ncbi:AAA family ATPase [candidate division CSSED10-310 bacterium]|uniref:AAA family ATPase n=1 Tax=candidate division CSSED10-310 bacterium TaxID=2855610 RepID=A0ABV6YXQ0_UNCC1
MTTKPSEHYKFRAIKVFGSTESLANQEKRYQVVYEESVSTYIYCEFSFYNKLFDEKDWKTKITLKCFESSSSKLICDREIKQDVKQDENIVYIREGWGNDTPGAFWRRGSYRWQAWIDDVYVDEITFYIEKEGPATPEKNPYFNIQSIKFYEAPYEGLELAKRKYLKAFNGAETRYIWAELNAENLIKNYKFWACELKFNFRKSSGYLKGKDTQVRLVYPHEDSFSVCIGWGSSNKTCWVKDHYSLDLIFMDQLIATMYFEVEDTDIPASAQDFIPAAPGISTKAGSEAQPASSDTENLEEVMQELNELIGLESIKNRIKEYATYLDFLSIRMSKGIDEEEKINLHSVFTGSPGTGKTTVARLLGKIYKHLGLLSKGMVLTVDRAELVGPFIGQTAPKTKETIDKARGGILLIDEAYSLARKDDDSKDFGHEVIEILVKEMSDGPGDIAIIVAGYTKEMEIFLNSNPGLKSRFNLYFQFPDYLPQELLKISDYGLKRRKLTITAPARELLYKKLVEAYRNRTLSFGNARYVNSLIDESKMNLGLRVMALPNHDALTVEQLSTIQPADIEKIFTTKQKSKADIPIDEDYLKDSIKQLKSMVGLDEIKCDIDEIVKLVRFYREMGKDVCQVFSLHSVFMGNPGTGKTTVARLLANIFKALGILERGHLVECDKQALVAGYIGQTTQKTAALIDQAMGGILFIDEAYSLAEGGERDYGREAMEILLKRMEDHRGEVVVIVAGYTNKMETFLESNPGVKSRFDRYFTFPDYDPDELYDISLRMLEETDISPDRAAQKHLRQYFEFLYQTKDEYFGNGRTARKIIEEAIKNQNLRLADLPRKKRKPELLQKLILKDIEEFKIDLTKCDARKRTIGFSPP